MDSYGVCVVPQEKIPGRRLRYLTHCADDQQHVSFGQARDCHSIHVVGGGGGAGAAVGG